MGGSDSEERYGTINRLLADDFSGTTDDQIYSKADAIEDVKSGTHESLDLDNIKVRLFGDTAVVTRARTKRAGMATQISPATISSLTFGPRRTANGPRSHLTVPASDSHPIPDNEKWESLERGSHPTRARGGVLSQ